MASQTYPPISDKIYHVISFYISCYVLQIEVLLDAVIDVTAVYFYNSYVN
jgi:hypothetical protein